jgi:hypothetical protein
LTGSGALDAKNAEKRWRCGSSSLKGPVSIRARSNARNALSSTPWWYRSPTRGLYCVIAGINGNTAASIAMMASRFFEGAPRFNRELAVFAADVARW